MYLNLYEKEFEIIHFTIIRLIVFLYVHVNYIPGMYIKKWNILPSQEPSYPDLSCPVASSQLAPPQESLDAKAVVDGENDDEEVDKMEVVTAKQ